jgi:hypothetical protein
MLEAWESGGVLAAVLAAVTVTVREVRRVAVAREQRLALTKVSLALGGAGRRGVRVQCRVEGGGQWSVECDPPPSAGGRAARERGPVPVPRAARRRCRSRRRGAAAGQAR